MLEACKTTCLSRSTSESGARPPRRFSTCRWNFRLIRQCSKRVWA